MDLSRVREQLLFARAIPVAMAAPLLVRLPLSRQEVLLEPRRQRPRSSPVSVERIVQIVDSAVNAGRPLTRPGCLTRGITRYWFLRRAGLELALVFGIGQVDERPRAHCWLERGGEPILEPKDPRSLFSPIAAIPARG